MSRISSLKGRRILITSYSYASFGGAELNAVELSDQLVRFGMIPTFFSYDIEGPLSGYIVEKFKTTVLTDQINKLSESEDEDEMGITKLDINDYDYIWVGGNTIPISILRQINSAKKIPKFIFIHMSPLIGFPLDAPLMPGFEKKIASTILSISEKTTTDNLLRMLGKKTPIGYWRNPVPVGFKSIEKRNGNLQKIAVISSSHPGSEVMGIKHILEQHNIQVDYIGKFNNNVKVVDELFYDEYDLIIGVGKNARYSLVSGVPIYVYGRFGGGGYIDESNLGINNAYNFSGRGFGRKDADVIADEIVAGYHDALSFHEKHRKRFINELSLDNVARELFAKLERQKNVTIKFEESYINWLISMQITLMQKNQSSAHSRNAQVQIGMLKMEIDKQRKEINILRETIATKKGEIRGIYSSWSWRTTGPLRSINGILRRALTALRKYR